MIGVQASAALGAVAVCLLLAGRFGLMPLADHGQSDFAAMLREIWAFGLVQLGGFVVLNLGGWWLTSLVARSDPKLAQVGLFSVASQLRNIVALAPALLSESALALMVGSKGSKETPARVLAICTFASVAVTVICSGLGILFVPWLLPAVYGKSYAAAELPATLALATAVVHMGTAPASARTTVLSIRYWGWTNAAWAVLVVVLSTQYVPAGGATAAAAVYLAAQFLVSCLLLGWLRLQGEAPAGVISLYACGSGAALIIAVLGCLRYLRPQIAVKMTLAMTLVLICAVWSVFMIGRRNGLAPGLRELGMVMRGLRPRGEWLRGGFRWR